MAWWDHEELKSHSSRSDRYIISFPSEYTKEEVEAAQKRYDEAERKRNNGKNSYT